MEIVALSYLVKHKDKEIVFEVNDGRITIVPKKNGYDNQGLVFMQSKPEMVKDIGEMLMFIGQWTKEQNEKNTVKEI